MTAQTTPLAELRKLRGTVEAPGAADNPVIIAWPHEIAATFPTVDGLPAYSLGYQHDSTAWCGLAMAIAHARCGILPPFVKGDDLRCYLWAASWSTWGIALAAPALGCVLVFKWPSGEHHVTMYLRTEGANYICLGGNQSDQLKESSYPASECVAMRAAPAANDVAIDVSPADEFPLSGKASWYSQHPPVWVDKADKPGSNKLEVPDECQGISFYDHSTLGHWFEVRAPNGIVSIEQQTEIGPAPRTGRTIDVSAVAAAERFNYTPSNFPTDGVFTWRPIAAPAAVANLSPQQQAIQFHQLRKGQPMGDNQPQPATSPRALPAPSSILSDAAKAEFKNFMREELNQFAQDAAKEAKAHPDEIAQAVTAAIAQMQKSGFSLSSLFSGLGGNKSNISGLAGGIGLLLSHVLQSPAVDVISSNGATETLLTSGSQFLLGAGAWGHLSQFFANAAPFFANVSKALPFIIAGLPKI